MTTLGLETARERYDTILVSEGGGHCEAEPDPHHDWVRHSYRILNVIDSQVRLEQGALRGNSYGTRCARTLNRPSHLRCAKDPRLTQAGTSPFRHLAEKQLRQAKGPARLGRWRFHVFNIRLNTPLHIGWNRIRGYSQYIKPKNRFLLRCRRQAKVG